MSHLNNFDGSEWLISVINFIRSDIIGVAQPLILQYHILSLIKFEVAGEVVIKLGWGLESRLESAIKFNNSGQKTESLYCLKDHTCAAFDLGTLTLQIKLWSRQLQVDLFPPHISVSVYDGIPTNTTLRQYFQDAYTLNTKLRFPILWTINISRPLLRPVLVSPVHVVHIGSFPQNHSGSSIKNEKVVQSLTFNNEYSRILLATNVQFFS